MDELNQVKDKFRQFANDYADGSDADAEWLR